MSGAAATHQSLRSKATRAHFPHSSGGDPSSPGRHGVPVALRWLLESGPYPARAEVEDAGEWPRSRHPRWLGCPVRDRRPAGTAHQRPSDRRSGVRRDERVVPSMRIGAVVRPGIAIRVLDHAGAHRVEFYVPVAMEQIAFAVDGTRLVAPLPVCPVRWWRSLDVAHVPAPERLHQRRHLPGTGSRQQQMHVVGHQQRRRARRNACARQAPSTAGSSAGSQSPRRNRVVDHSLVARRAEGYLEGRALVDVA